jgi:hypothetical protein
MMVCIDKEFLITDVESRMTLARSNVIRWTDKYLESNDDLDIARARHWRGYWDALDNLLIDLKNYEG